MKRFWLRRGLRFLGFGILFVGLAGLLTMTLWNALLPTILGVTTISFWQALGLLLLSRLLFGGPRTYGFGQGRFRGDYGRGERRLWKQHMAERWQNMTPEQRAQLKAQWRQRCGERSSRSRWNTPRPDQPTPDEPAGRDPGTTAI